MAELDEFKVIVVGDAGTGKTCMISSLVGEPIPKTYVQTQGVKCSKFHTTHQNKNILLKLWDLTGADNFRTFTAGCYSKANGAIITYRMNDYESLTNVSSWYANIKSVLTEIAHESDTFENLQICVIGLQNDSKRVSVTTDQGESAAQSIGCPHFIGSCKDPKSFHQMIDALIGRLIQQAQQDKKDKQLQRQRMQSKKEIDPDDPSQPLVKKDDENSPNICDCGCTIL